MCSRLTRSGHATSTMKTSCIAKSKVKTCKSKSASKKMLKKPASKKMLKKPASKKMLKKPANKPMTEDQYTALLHMLENARKVLPNMPVTEATHVNDESPDAQSPDA